MIDDLQDVKKRQRILAKDENRVRAAINAQEREAPLAGAQRGEFGAVRGQFVKRLEFAMVRIVSPVVPQSSTWYQESLTHNPNGTNAFNAVIQVRDPNTNQWVDDPQNATQPLEGALDVVVQDDLQGWRPITVNDILPVQWNRTSGVYVPFHVREVAVIVPDGNPPDSQGMYSGWRTVYDSDAQAWVTKEQVYIIDLS